VPWIKPPVIPGHEFFGTVRGSGRERRPAETLRRVRPAHL